MATRVDAAPLSAETRDRLVAYIAEVGSLDRAARYLGCARESLARAAAGLAVRKGTALVIGTSIAAHGIV